MTHIGIFLRKLRIEHGEVLHDMAVRLNVSSAFLSTVENGRRSAPLSWIDAIAASYQLTDQQTDELTQAISESIKQIRTEIADVPPQKKEYALVFARTFDSISDETMKKIVEMLKARRH